MGEHVPFSKQNIGESYAVGNSWSTLKQATLVDIRLERETGYGWSRKVKKDGAKVRFEDGTEKIISMRDVVRLWVDEVARQVARQAQNEKRRAFEADAQDGVETLVRALELRGLKVESHSYTRHYKPINLTFTGKECREVAALLERL